MKQQGSEFSFTWNRQRDLTPAEVEEDNAQQARAEIEAMNKLAEIVKENEEGQGDAMEAQATLGVDPEVIEVVESLVHMVLKDSAANRLLDLVKSEPVKSERLCSMGVSGELYDSLRTLICSDHPSKEIAAKCMALLIEKAPRRPRDFATWLVRTDCALECLWRTRDSDEGALPVWLSNVMKMALPVECTRNRPDLCHVHTMMSRAIQSQQSELILQLTRVMGPLAVQACANHFSEETRPTATETTPLWKDVITGLWVRADFRSKMQKAEHDGVAWETDIPASDMRTVVAYLRKSFTLPSNLVDVFKEMIRVEQIALPVEQMAEAAALSLANGERNGIFLIVGVLRPDDYVLDLKNARSFCGRILSNKDVVKVLVDCLDVTHEVSQADKEVVQYASNILALLNRYTDQGVPLGCDTIAELVRYAEGQNEENEQLKKSLESLSSFLLELTKKLSKKRLIEFVDAYYTQFPGGPLAPPPGGEQGAANDWAQLLHTHARGFYAAFALGNRLENAFPQSTRDSCSIDIPSLAKQAHILRLGGTAESVLKNLGACLDKHRGNVEKARRESIDEETKQDFRTFEQRITRIRKNIRFLDNPKEKHLKAFKSIWASYSPVSTLTLADVGGGSPSPLALPPAPCLALLAPSAPPAPLVAVPVGFTQDDFNTKFAERVILVEGCDRQAHL